MKARDFLYRSAKYFFAAITFLNCVVVFAQSKSEPRPIRFEIAKLNWNSHVTGSESIIASGFGQPVCWQTTDLGCFIQGTGKSGVKDIVVRFYIRKSYPYSFNAQANAVRTKHFQTIAIANLKRFSEFLRENNRELVISSNSNSVNYIEPSIYEFTFNTSSLSLGGEPMTYSELSFNIGADSPAQL